ncbi:tetratricopeptide repeat protein [Paraglaciecola sp. 2405UD69-4]|uniref:tetratricopeptide repeat protein n=1 Tax=Paraglaciecola sp. 2405UD69-4 TaxID=3391836 RepID=UPI0039C8D08E
MLILSSAKRCWFSLLVSVMLFGCQSTRTANFSNQAPAILFYDQGFPEFLNHHIETEPEIFYLGAKAKQFVFDTIEPFDSEVDKAQALVHNLFDRSELNLLYQASANTVANDTFLQRAANCLSMSIMTYALAQEAGLNIKFQEVLIPEYWTRRDGYSFLNGHINLKYTPNVRNNTLSLGPRSFQIDFDPQASRELFSKQIIPKKAVIAMFYNNKGADALVEKHYSKAYAYFKQAALTYPRLNNTWINLGILYRQNNYFDKAEKAYLKALDFEPNSLTAWENLAYLYKHTDQQEKAQEIIHKVKRKRSKNPYYHVSLGEQEIEQRNWSQALEHFKKALGLNKDMHEGYYGIAKVYYETGKLEKSARYLKLAKTKAVSDHDEEKYQSKMDFLSSL